MLIDAADLHLLSTARRVRVDKLGYVWVSYVVGEWQALHRVITSASPGQSVDHVNHDPSDNRRANLRVCTHAENMRNRRRPSTNKCGLKGVYERKDRRTRRFCAQIKLNGQRRNLGYYATAQEAHAAYCVAARELHGEFARFN